MLHSNIKFLRNRQKLSQENFGKIFGLTRGMVDSYERKAASPDTMTIAAIAKHFDISIDNLLTKDFDKNPILIYQKDERQPDSTILQMKDELIISLKEEIKFLRSQLVNKTQ